MADIEATQTSKSDEWATPRWLVNLLQEEFGPFDLDACATSANAVASRFYTEADNGLIQPWFGVTFCNPPYSQAEKWAQKAWWEAYLGNATVLYLCAARPDTRYWWDHIRYGEVRLIKGRLRFTEPGNPKAVGAPFPSALVVFRRRLLQYSPTTVYWDIPKEVRQEVNQVELAMRPLQK